MLTLTVKVHCDACHGRGLLQGPWRMIDDVMLPTYERDCEKCGGKGSYPQTVTLDQTAITQIAQAVAQTMEQNIRLSAITREYR